ncbi:MAG TPA: ABC transporter permease [Aminivibrio sp.]|uniref:ABC transporter permease n=1 Tax=Aminivibrio sp. TaxID=1872489 RepID=UPI002BB0CB00|nr:ABC transporter permease [Aminivibrio sp.]HPF85013.1 ABC transporter permease [Aminivibrio sp.]
MQRSSREWLFLLSMGSFLVLYILWPLGGMFLRADWGIVASSFSDSEIVGALWRSIWTAAAATGVIALFGTPLAYFLARNTFRGKSVLEAIIDVPIMIPHTVAGIAVLMAFSPKAPAGALLTKAGLSPVNSHLGIILACMFVSIPFYVDAARDAFYGVSPRIERAARTLGAPFLSVFFRVSLPLARKGLISGLIMSWARSVSEFGAVVIIAYHPMVAPTLIYDRFATFGLKYSTPVAVQLILVCLGMFVVLRLLAAGKRREDEER